MQGLAKVLKANGLRTELKDNLLVVRPPVSLVPGAHPTTKSMQMMVGAIMKRRAEASHVRMEFDAATCSIHAVEKIRNEEEPVKTPIAFCGLTKGRHARIQSMVLRTVKTNGGVDVTTALTDLLTQMFILPGEGTKGGAPGQRAAKQREQ